MSIRKLLGPRSPWPWRLLRVGIPTIVVLFWGDAASQTVALFRGRGVDPWEAACWFLSGCVFAFGSVWLFWDIRLPPSARDEQPRGAGGMRLRVRRAGERATSVLVVLTAGVLVYQVVEFLLRRTVNSFQFLVWFATFGLASVLWVLARAEIGPRWRPWEVADLKLERRPPSTRTRRVVLLVSLVAMLGMLAVVGNGAADILEGLRAGPWWLWLLCAVAALSVGAGVIGAARLFAELAPWRPAGSSDQRS